MSRYFVTMPQLGESVTEGTVVRWLVNPGDSVAELDPMVEINTDKVDAEVPAPITGVLTEILAPEGAVVRIGGNIAVMEVVQTGHDADNNGDSASETNDATVILNKSSAPTEEAKASPTPRQKTATSSADSQQIASARRREAAAHQPRPTLDGDKDILLTPVRRRIAENMALSKATIPHAWQVQEVDMSGVAASIAANRGTFRRKYGATLTYLPYVIAAVASSLRSHPTVNSTFAHDRIILRQQVNIGIAVGLAEGVIVPVIRGAGQLPIAELAISIGDLTARARAKTLSYDDLADATLTVNNSGALGTLLSYSVITPGQSAVVTMGAVVDRPVAADGKAVVRPMMYLCLSIDHRVMDGLEAAMFLGACRSWLEDVTVSTALS